MVLLTNMQEPSYCGQQSILAVSPMHEMYTNTNHVNCPYSTNSVMRDPYSTNGISLSSMRFIGWGDYDSDGILDPLDGTPLGLIPHIFSKVGSSPNPT
jgi:hypothetical protein